MFNREKPKFNSKVRFQHRTFVEKLKAAQGYKRQAKKIPETDQEKILSGLGLDSLWSKIAVGLGILILIYLVYIPNFLFIKTIEVQGAEGDERNHIIVLTKEYFKQSALYAPQRNLIFLDGKKLADYLVKHDPQLKSVIKTTKDLGKITLAIELKQEKFELVSANGNYALYNDGTFSRDLANLPIEQKPGLLKVETKASLELRPGESFFSGQVANALTKIQIGFPPNRSFVLDYFELPVASTELKQDSLSTGDDLNLLASPLAVLIPNELVVYTKPAEKFNAKPFKVYFDASSDIEKAMVNFSALMTELPPNQLASLAYVDMRFPDRSFVCLSSAACAVARPVPDSLNPLNIEQSQENQAATVQSSQ